MENSSENKLLNWLNQSLTVKMAVICVMILILMIPLFFIQDLIGERAQRQSEVISEINEKWGKEHLITGPIVKVPYTKREIISTVESNSKNVITTENTSTSYIYFSPEKIDGKTNLNVEMLKRGIYKSAVYEGTLNLSGELAQATNSNELIKNEDIHWDKSTIILQTTNIKGIKNNLSIKIGDETLQLAPKIVENDHINTIESNPFDFKALSEAKFDFKLLFNGSEKFSFIPIGKTTKFNVNSNWTSPSFTGEYLPKNESEKVNENGFNANWDILYFNRPFSQIFYDQIPNLKEYSFGVSLLIPVDEYQKSERATKYGFLVISFTFLFFFLIQAVTKINIHPFQYFLIGLALIMFYTLLISISEHSNFLKAYFIAGISVIGLISVYAHSVLKKPKFALFIALSLAALYAFIYTIIQLENYALLVGSIGLFIILAIVMYVSRKIDWK